MATRRCPKCQLINPGGTTMCDCGYSFADGTMSAPRELPGLPEHEVRSDRRSRGIAQLALGAVLLVAGIVITSVTYGRASVEGGTYIVAYGPIAFGVITIVRGAVNMRG